MQRKYCKKNYETIWYYNITNWKFLDVKDYDLVRVVEEGFHLVHHILHRNGSVHTVICPPHRVGVRIVSDSDIQISDPVDQLREHVHILQFNYPNDYQQRLFHILIFIRFKRVS